MRRGAVERRLRLARLEEKRAHIQPESKGRERVNFLQGVPRFSAGWKPAALPNYTADMGNFLKQRRLGLEDLAMVASAMGAVAVGAFAVGALTIRWLAIGRLEEGNAKVISLEVQDLAVTRLPVGDVAVTGALELPETDEAPKMTS
jgi:hypothetical protein